MTEPLIAQAEVVVHATPERVWQALTEPEQIEKYLFGTHVETDWKPGSPIIYRGVWQGQAYEDKGVILEVEPGRRLVSTFWSALSGVPDEPAYYKTVDLRTESGGDCHPRERDPGQQRLTGRSRAFEPELGERARGHEGHGRSVTTGHELRSPTRGRRASGERGGKMKPKISMITLGTRDLERVDQVLRAGHGASPPSHGR